MKKPKRDPCDCGSGRSYDGCCGRYHGGEPAPTAEALMRSRYSAYCRGLRDYLRATWHPRTLAAQALGDTDDAPVKWIGLSILATRGGGPDDDAGEVEFIARCKIGGRAQRLHEISRFTRIEGRWVYVDGERGANDSSRNGH